MLPFFDRRSVITLPRLRPLMACPPRHLGQLNL
jgi:hypothetical protein